MDYYLECYKVFFLEKKIQNTRNIEDIKKQKYLVKTIKVYKMLTQIHLINYKIIKIMLKIIFTFMDCLAKRVKILENMKKNIVCLGKQERGEIN